MLKISEKLLGLQVNNEQKINQAYFDASLEKVTYLEINSYRDSEGNNLEPDHHAGEVLNSIQASGGQFTHDNYPVTDDDLKTEGGIESSVVLYSSLNWDGEKPVLSDNADSKKPTELADQYSYNLLCKSEVQTEDGQKLGKVNDVYINQDGKIEGFELSEGFLSDFLMSGQPFMKVDESVRLVDGKVIVPEDYHKNLAE